MEKQIEIIIADDHLLFIDGLSRLLEDEEEIKVIKVANDGKELLHILGTQQSDVILMDINMPKLNGLNATQLIRRTYPNIKVIMLSTYHEDHLIEKARENGASGYLLKNINQAELVNAIKK